jgi:hypothetical protein
MKKPSKKLALAGETLRRLHNTQLHAVAGGQTIAMCTTACSDDLCPDTQFNHGCNSNTVHC